ncbi:hypothetical protein Tco_0445945 [Tanacetum coccineum]
MFHIIMLLAMASAVALGIYLAYVPYEEEFQYLAFILAILKKVRNVNVNFTFETDCAYASEVHREVDVRTNVHHDVDEGLSVSDVHHDVEKGLSVPELLKKIMMLKKVLSVPELLKKISNMQRDFQSRITTVELFVNHKTSKIGSDSHVTNVFRNSMEFDHHCEN